MPKRRLPGTKIHHQSLGKSVTPFSEAWRLNAAVQSANILMLGIAPTASGSLFVMLLNAFPQVSPDLANKEGREVTPPRPHSLPCGLTG